MIEWNIVGLIVLGVVVVWILCDMLVPKKQFKPWQGQWPKRKRPRRSSSDIEHGDSNDVDWDRE